MLQDHATATVIQLPSNNHCLAEEGDTPVLPATWGLGLGAQVLTSMILCLQAAKWCRRMESADSELKQTALLYETADSYMDEGSVSMRYVHPSERESESSFLFKTFFRRPEFLRFDWRSCSGKGTGDASLLCHDEVVRLTHQSKVSTFSTLSAGIEAGANVTKGVVHTIAGLLLPALNIGHLTHARVEQSSDDFIGEEKCRKLKVVVPAEEDVSTYLWLSLEERTILRIERAFSTSPSKELARLGSFRWVTPAYWKLQLFHRDTLEQRDTHFYQLMDFKKVELNRDLPADVFASR